MEQHQLPAQQAVIEPTRGRLDCGGPALQAALAMSALPTWSCKSFFRDHHELGQNDRGFVAELVFTVLRHLRLLETPRRRADSHDGWCWRR